jgi:uncharacterized protein (TIGR03000 family)
MVRHWFSFSALLALAAVMVASDAGQARERRLLRRWRGESDTTYVATGQPETMMVGTYVDDTVVMPTQTYVSQDRGRRFGRRRNSGETIVTGTPRSEMRQSMYPPESAMGQNSVFLSVRVRPNAEVLFDGAKTTQRGDLRRFISPPINPDRQYVYEITAKWMEDGQTRTQTKKVDVRAGQSLMVDLTQPQDKEKIRR